MMPARFVVCLALLAVAACSSGSGETIEPTPVPLDASAPLAPDPSAFDNAEGTRPIVESQEDAVRNPDGTINPDAFFAEDPPPMYCGPDGVPQEAEVPGGTPECPDDKNREGCPCDTPGETASCWPGLRVNRNRGICQDGKTVCVDTEEFGSRWGPCEGYVLPEQGAQPGPQTCECFSSGTWKLSNIAPCILKDEPPYLYSSYLDEDGNLVCTRENEDRPPPLPPEDWSQSTLNAECAGNFELCYAIKAGDVDNPDDSDCELVRMCFETWYETPGTDQQLPALPAWTSDDTACATEFRERGGYGEMTVSGLSAECVDVGDGEGGPRVFHYIRYCPEHCQETPDTEECRPCQVGASGSFSQ